MAAIFSIVPIEVWRDKRLTLKQVRVLGVLFSFREKNTNVVWPSRQKIADRCGMNPCDVSTATTALERLGWLSKDGKGGHSKATRYTITAPSLLDDGETVADSTTVVDSATVADSTTRLPVADSTTGKEHTSEQTTTTRSKPNSPKFDARTHLLDIGVSAELISDWLALRKAKKAPVTKIAMAGIEREASKAGITIADALRLCCERGWQGFNAEWVQSKPATALQSSDLFKGGI